MINQILQYIKTRDRVWWIEWAGTSFLMVGAFLNAFLIAPYNTIFSFTGNFLWGIVGVYWKKPSLIIISLILTVVYVSGFVSTFF